MKNLIIIFIISLIYTLGKAQSDNHIVINGNNHTGSVEYGGSNDKWFLTVSYDKTAKLWNKENLTLIKTYRFPIGENELGRLRSGSIHPKNSIGAVSSNLNLREKKAGLVYIFDLNTGEIIKTIVADKIIGTLFFTPNGEYLITSFYNENEYQVYETKTWQLSGKKLLRNPTSFSSDNYGSIIAISYWGETYLYDNDFNVIKFAQQRFQEKNLRPVNIFYKDNQMLLHVKDYPFFYNMDEVSLETKEFLDLTGIDRKSIVNSAMLTQCGKYLFASFYLEDKVNNVKEYTLRRWNLEDNTYRDYNYGITPIRLLASFKNGILFSKRYEDFGLVNLDMEVLYENKSDILDFSANTIDEARHIRVNVDGSEIGFTPRGGSPFTFSLSNMELKQALAPYPNSIDKGGSTQISNWFYSKDFTVNGKYLSNYIQETSCADVSKNGNFLVVGSYDQICCFRPDGRMLWRAFTQSSVTSVKISGNEKVLVVAQSNGIIQWYDAENGSLINSLYTHPDGRRWILYSNDGYYECSIGGEELAGWLVNDGINKVPNFFSLARFRNSYYKPNYFSQVLAKINSRSESKIDDQINSIEKKQTSFPPVVKINSPYSGTKVFSNTVSVSYVVNSPSDAPILSIKALVDGRPVDNQRGFKSLSKPNEIIVNIPSANCTISLIAENKYGYSEPGYINLEWAGVVNPKDILKPTLYLLAIGVSEYNNPDLRLKFAAKDATDFSNTLKNQKGNLYKDVVISLLTDKNATKENILDGLEWLQSQTTSRDVAMIFLAGHGVNDNVGTFYFLPVGADLNRIKSTCVIFEELKNSTSAIPGKVLMFIDACHSGNVMGGRRAALNIEGMVNELVSAENGVIVFTSSTGRQFSLENATWGNGAFTKALVEGLSGKADLFKNGQISIKSLDAYIADRVKQLTGGKQSPTTIIPFGVQDFPIIVVR